jgi:tetratricopeptide (TPR) repeat protein
VSFRPRRTRVLFVALSTLALATIGLAGCTALGGLGRSGEPEVVERPAAPPDYDYLVARQLELEGSLEESLAAYQRALAKDPESALLHRKVAELLARAGRPEEAVGFAERALELEPTDADLRIFLGTLHRIRRDVASAERILLEPDGAPLDPDAALLLYGLYADAGRRDEALRIARWMVRTEPTSLRSYFALARALERLERHAEAERALRQALRHEPENLSVYAALARARRQRGDREGEIAIYREVLDFQPDHHATLVALADAHIALERWDDARRVLEAIEQRYPEDLRSVVRLGYLDLEQKDYAAASLRFEQALLENPEQHEVHYLLGMVQRRAGQLDAALASFGRVPPEHERWSDARLQVAAIREQQRDFSGALVEADAVRARAPSRALDLYVASLRVKSGDFDGAVAFLSELLEASPGDEELLFNLGVVHGESGRTEESLRYMNDVLAANPDHPGALNYIGYTLAEQGRDLDEAEQMIARALEQRPDDGYITDSLGWVYYMRAKPLMASGESEQEQRGRALLERAIRELERAAQLTGGDPVISEHLGDAYRMLGDKPRALRFYEEALSLDPRSGEQPELLEKREQLRRELGLQ